MNDAENQRDAPKWGHPCDCGLWHCTMEDKARADAEWAKLWHRLDAAIARAEQAERERDRYRASAWPEEVHAQYLATLDERDAALARAERAEEERDTLREALEKIERGDAGLTGPAVDIARDALAAVSPPQEGEA